MRSIWIALFCAGLAACSGAPTTEQEPAGVEDRKPTAKPENVTTNPVQGKDLTGSKMSPDQMLKTGVLAQRSIFYDLDQYDIKDQYKALVEAHARYLRDNPKAKMLIQGNTDERGSREYNVALGQRRSDGVKKMLLLLGAKEDQVESVSLGEEKPRMEGHDEQAWSQNRRCDILYQGEY
ncbi:MAG TPA: peptidoglycan-associated lipoprotein Pal [Burkholderiales bacterium]|nr:peptidoglycan-associated lipoprotein Pal [Burkholderiales bacterium]